MSRNDWNYMALARRKVKDKIQSLPASGCLGIHQKDCVYMKLRAAGLTDVGKVRAHNEDHCAVLTEHGLFVVADGMGGQLAGEVASRMAVDILCEQLLCPNEDAPFPDTAANRMVAAIRLANRTIHTAGETNPDWKNMGTTVVAAEIADARLLVAHVGDSRCYLLRDRNILQLTEDHSLVAEQQRRGLISKEEAATSRMKNVITRAVGAFAEVNPDVHEVDLLAGDRVLLCSDGLSNMVADEELLAVAARHDDPGDACAQMVAMANQRGGRDNITVILVVME